MKNNLQTIYQNINKIKERDINSKQHKDYWIKVLINNLIKAGASTPAGIAEELNGKIELSLDEKITLAGEIVKQSRPELPLDFVLDPIPKRKLIVSNFRGALSDVAVSKLCQNSRFNVINKDSFIESFDDVYNGRATHCIAPIENTASGKLLNFYSMIANYNLKIEAVCDIEHNDQDTVTKFALLSKGPISLNLSIKENLYAEFSLNIGKNGDVSRIIAAASEFGFSVSRIDSIPYAHYSNEYSYYIVFRLRKDALLEELLSFLILENVAYTPIGIFSHIK